MAHLNIVEIISVASRLAIKKQHFVWNFLAGVTMITLNISVTVIQRYIADNGTSSVLNVMGKEGFIKRLVVVRLYSIFLLAIIPMCKERWWFTL